jgi:hypothetical protein
MYSTDGDVSFRDTETRLMHTTSTMLPGNHISQVTKGMVARLVEGGNTKTQDSRSWSSERELLAEGSLGCQEAWPHVSMCLAKQLDLRVATSVP